MQVVRHPMDTALSCYAQPFEGRGTPWAWDLHGTPKLQQSMRLLPTLSHTLTNVYKKMPASALRYVGSCMHVSRRFLLI